mmetsp:Transcript_5302/g.15733  ORF Transcript_5302/g.15733 Transcript_5302/m.15733 type:complete len:220 (-) Transcript_5302:1041-1700(-)
MNMSLNISYSLAQIEPGPSKSFLMPEHDAHSPRTHSMLSYEKRFPTDADGELDVGAEAAGGTTPREAGVASDEAAGAGMGSRAGAPRDCGAGAMGGGTGAACGAAPVLGGGLVVGGAASAGGACASTGGAGAEVDDAPASPSEGLGALSLREQVSFLLISSPSLGTSHPQPHLRHTSWRSLSRPLHMQSHRRWWMHMQVSRVESFTLNGRRSVNRVMPR